MSDVKYSDGNRGGGNVPLVLVYEMETENPSCFETK